MTAITKRGKDRLSFIIWRLKNAKQQFINFNRLYKKSNGKASYVRSYLYIYQWWKSLKPNRGPLADQKPWIVYDSLKFLDSIVNKEMIVFEYGTGGSSAYFSKKVKQVFSVEHDKEWLRKTAMTINSIGNNNWNGAFINALHDPIFENKDSLVPTDYISHLTAFKGKHFFNYASYIDQFDNGFFDIVMIDGRARTSCFIHAKGKVKIDGYLILDNSERDRYDAIHATLKNEGWLKFNFFGPGPYVDSEFWQTTIWQRIV